MLTVTAVQPPYHAGEHPDEYVAEFLIDAMNSAPDGGLILLPEYSNAGGLSDPADEMCSLWRARVMLEAASESARRKRAFVGVNVLEERCGELRNSTYLFGRDGSTVFVYDKIHLPPSEVKLGIKAGDGSCICSVEGLKLGFMTCYDVYYSEQIEYFASEKPDIILVPGYQRGERVDIIRAQAKLAAFRCNAHIVRSSFSMASELHGGCSMIVSPEGEIIADLGSEVGSISRQIEPTHKYMRPAGFGEGLVRNDDFINAGLRPELFTGG